MDSPLDAGKKQYARHDVSKCNLMNFCCAQQIQCQNSGMLLNPPMEWKRILFYSLVPEYSNMANIVTAIADY